MDNPENNLVKLNLYCKIPDQIILRQMGCNSDNNINTKYSLIGLKQLLHHDLKVIDAAINNHMHIDTIMPLESNVAVSIKNDIVQHKLGVENITTNLHHELYDEEQEYLVRLNDHEDPQQRNFRMLRNLLIDENRHPDLTDKPITYLINQYHSQSKNNQSDSEDEFDQTKYINATTDQTEQTEQTDNYQNAFVPNDMDVKDSLHDLFQTENDTENDSYDDD
jgi:hypothetical protein